MLQRHQWHQEELVDTRCRWEREKFVNIVRVVSRSDGLDALEFCWLVQVVVLEHKPRSACGNGFLTPSWIYNQVEEKKG